VSADIENRLLFDAEFRYAYELGKAEVEAEAEKWHREALDWQQAKDEVEVELETAREREKALRAKRDVYLSQNLILQQDKDALRSAAREVLAHITYERGEPVFLARSNPSVDHLRALAILDAPGEEG
jgi:hypothetical protein